MNKLSFFQFAFALFSAIFIISCSNEIDPDVYYKGTIDSSFLTALSRGEISITLKSTGCDSYVMDYAVFGSANQKWEPMERVDVDLPLPSKITIFDGHTLDMIESYSSNPYLHLGEPTLLVMRAWPLYCDKINSEVTIGVEYPFEFNPQEKKLLLNQKEYDVEKAENNEIIISITYVQHYKTIDGEKIPDRMGKTFLTFTKIELEAPRTDNLLSFKTDKEAFLGMVKREREVLGDTVRLADMWYFDNQYVHKGTYTYVNLAVAENYILNNVVYNNEEKYNSLCWHTDK